MSSSTEKQQEWPAVRVRDTFLDYFKERGHTFGMQKLLEEENGLLVV